MFPKNTGQLLFNAVRETLETMAFAEVIPCSIKVGDEECTTADDDFSVGAGPEADVASGWGDEENSDAPADDWGTGSGIIPAIEGGDAWGTTSASSASDVTDQADAWGESGSTAVEPQDDWSTPSSTIPSDSWGAPEEPEAEAVDEWGTPSAGGAEDDGDWGEISTAPPDNDPWGDSAALGSRVEGLAMKPKEIDFDNMVENQADWCWACMKVNSPDIHSVWLIISKGLANALAQNMYAGEDFQLDNPLIRDLIAELTNVLGGRLMLLLEELGGKFTLTVPEIGFGMPKIPDSTLLETVLCKVVVDGEYPVIVALCFNQGGIAAP